MTKNKTYLPLVLSLYTNFIFQGIAAIAISQNLTLYQERWHASLSQVTLVISAIGIGRILSLPFSGYFSDVFGRKKSVILGILSYIVFFSGLVLVSDYRLAFVTSLSAGLGNAFLDTSTYPTVIEAYPEEKYSTSLSVLNKAFISIGQFVFPILTSWTLNVKWHFSWILWFSISLLILNAFLVYQMNFPMGEVSHKHKKKVSVPSGVSNSGAKFSIEGSCLLIFSFVSVSLFNILVLWIPTFAEQILHVSKSQSLLLVSLYSAASFISVFFTSFIMSKGVNATRFILICLGMTILSILLMLVLPVNQTVICASLVIGFFAAGGIWQIGLALLLELFPEKRGIRTSYYSLATAISVAVTPYLTGIMAEQDIKWTFYYQLCLAVIGLIVIAIVNYRYQHAISNSN
ncbi:MFS transporter [Streptococcus halotolerans]|uniref:MFS transporter n=1 Tax=Streptococcus halotolerans TaxID=1814128 RepID=UPI00078955F8|nr:MFS transporter [Streptococcus halotolerans]